MLYFPFISGIMETARMIGGFFMSFVPNRLEEQQLSLFDPLTTMTEREKKFLDRSWAKYFAEQPLSDRTLSRFRARCAAYETEHGVDLLHETITSLSSEWRS